MLAPTPAAPTPSGFDAFHAAWKPFLDVLAELRRMGSYPYLEHAVVGPGPWIEVGGERLLNFGSNDYLALARDPRVIEGAAEATRRYGVGSSGSALYGGLTPLHGVLEERLAALTRQERAIVFPSGYQGNVGVITALVGRGDTVLLDRADHASIVDACTMAGAAIRLFHHNDLDHLDRRLATATGRRLVVVESFYSMDGDGPDLRRVCEVAERHGAMVMVDEAHSFGICAPDGGGAVVEQGLSERVAVVFGTLSKALGGQGGFVAGNAQLIDHLQHTSHGYIFTTAIAPPLVGAAVAALDVLAAEPERIARLWALTRRFQAALRAAGCDLRASRHPITPIFVPPGDDSAAMIVFQTTRALRAARIWALPVLPPVVPREDVRIRFRLRADLSEALLANAVDAIVAAGRATGMIRPAASAA
ncbi:MAG TPA: 8-amino-7-oxononanoate synthase [Candidatus Binatia bacterium]|nr:8-amino-7-oxononanoate synthase [Candidatus Binatia bacterium]